MTTRYVSTSGNDANAGTSLSPWRTIQKACNSATTGDTVVISAGTYAPFASTRNLYIEAAVGATVIVQPVSSYSPSYSTAAGPEYVGRISGWTAGHVKGIQFRCARYQWGAGLYVVNCHGTGSEGSRSISIENVTTDHNHSMGLYVVDSSGIDVIGNTSYKNDTGAQFSRSFDCWVFNPVYHDNDELVDPGRGGNGIVFYRSHDIHVEGSDPSLYTGAVFYNHRCGSTQYSLDEADQDGYPGRDGGAFEYFESWNIEVEKVRGWANHNVLETGQTSTTARSDGISFHHNVFYADDPDYTPPYWTGRTYGMILRAAQNGLVHHNTLDGLGKETVLVMSGGSFAGTVDGLEIRDNALDGPGNSSRLESIPTGAPVTADFDLLYNPGGTTGVRAGDEDNGVFADPLFADRATRDFRPAVSSPLIGAASDGSDIGAIPFDAGDPPPDPDPEPVPDPDPEPGPDPIDPDPPSVKYNPGKGRGRKALTLL